MWGRLGRPVTEGPLPLVLREGREVVLLLERIFVLLEEEGVEKEEWQRILPLVEVVEEWLRQVQLELVLLP